MPRLIFANQLRGLAALSVLGSHLVGVYWGMSGFVALATATPVQDGSPPAALYAVFHQSWLEFGPLGVGVFFLISGLVIPVSLEQHSRTSFLLARTLRIYPTYVAALLLEMAVLHACAAWWEKPFPYGDWTIVANALLIQDLVDVPTVDLVNWTLCIELKFYLLAALLAGPIRRGSLAAVFAVPAAVLAGNLLAGWAPVSGLIGRPDLIDGLGTEAVFVVLMMVGVLFHMRWRSRLERPAFFVALAAMTALFALCWWFSPLRGQTTYILPNYFYALSVFGVMFALRGRFRPVRLLDAAAAISFPLYLVHALVGYSVLKALTLGAGLGYLPSLAAAVCAALALAAVLHVAIEQPTSALGRSLAKRRGIDPSLLAADLRP
jgi:peptidoglycan/LPS O-acetylase OafA/YrhL